jgi:YVTN family beta-propeller protein
MFSMLALPGPYFCHSLLTLGAIFANPLGASVAYIQNCCNHPSTVSVIDTATGRQKTLWTVGKDANQVVFSPDGELAYVSNTVSKSVTVVEVATGNVVTTIPVDYQITYLAITPDGRTLFAQSYDYAYVSHIVEIDTITNTVTRAAQFNAVLSTMVVSPNGKHLYTDSYFSSNPGLLVLDTVFLNIQDTIPMGAANGLAISPDGRYVYVANLGGSPGPYTPNVAVVDTSINTVTATIPLDTKLNPGPVQISPDGSRLWESEFPLYNYVAPPVVVISTATNQVEGQFTLPGKKVPGGIAFSPHGKVAWVVAGGAAVDTVEVATWRTVSQINTLGALNQPAVSPDGTILLLPNSGDSQVASFSASNYGRIAETPTGAMNWSTSQNPSFIQSGGATASPDGRRIYVTNQFSNNVNVIATDSKQVITSVEVGAEPVAVIISPDGSNAYVANSFDNTVSIINTKTFRVRHISMPTYTYPSAIAVTPDSSRVYIAGNNPIPDFGNCGCRVWVVDTVSDKVVDSIRLDYPQALAVSPDGTRLYVVSGGTLLYTLSTATNKVISNWPSRAMGRWVSPPPAASP